MQWINLISQGRTLILKPCFKKIQTAGCCVSVAIHFYFFVSYFWCTSCQPSVNLKSRPEAKPSQRQQLLHFGYWLPRDTRCCRMKDIQFCDLNNWTLNFDQPHFWNDKSLARRWRLQMFYWKQIFIFMQSFEGGGEEPWKKHLIWKYTDTNCHIGETFPICLSSSLSQCHSFIIVQN